MNTMFKIIIPVFNSEKWIANCIKSVLKQTYKNYQCVIIDDSSTDKTLDVIKETLKNKHEGKFIVRHRTLNCGAMENIVYGIDQICNHNDEVIVLLDGDDWLASDDVLEYLNSVYQDTNIWLTYGHYTCLSNNLKGSCNAPVTDTVNYRKNPRWSTSHLRTFKYKIWKLIKDEDLRDDFKKYYAMAWDQAIMFPLVEMCGPSRIKFIEKVLYIYNDLNPLNDHKKNLSLQYDTSVRIRNKPSYSILTENKIPEINSIIFSKDRPAQLELLLRSIKKFVVDFEKYNFSILYYPTNDDYLAGYEKVKQIHNEFNFVKQINFKSDLVGLVKDTNPYTFMGVDDDVFIENFDIISKEFSEFEANGRILSLSLRMGKRINYCYSMNMVSPPPVYEKSGVWDWTLSQADWAYPMSIDFSIFRTKEIIDTVKNGNYNNPNLLEGILAANPNRNQNLMISYDNPKIVGIPANKVQNIFNNRSANVSLEALNRNFLEGKRISLKEIINTKNNAPHMEINFTFENFI